jgi:trans-2,3-dihydro-3-hydroxyanthranilate isomerase
MLRLDKSDVLPGARWINTGTEQLIVPLTSADAVRRAQPISELLLTLTSDIGRSMAYVFATDDSPDGAADGATKKLRSRFFFMKHNAIIEDPGTGSATANLGGWMLHHGHTPCSFNIAQGEATGKPCHLGLLVDAAHNIFVSGRVIDIGRGTISLPD